MRAGTLGPYRVRMSPAAVRPDWHDPAWRAAVHAWIADRCAGTGRTLTGPVQDVRVRPWSVVSRAPTTGGDVWFKANSTGSGYEAALVAALARWTPGAVLRPLAVDTGRSWLLCPDAGPTLRDVFAGAPDLGRWERMLAAYAALQRDLAPRAGDLLALGVPDMRPARMPGHLEHLLDDPDVRQDLPNERLAALRALRPEYARWCAELAADGVPASVQHDDLHDGNVFPDGAGYRFFDWGDASVAHPFASLLIALSVATHLFDLAPDAPERRRLRDAYLEPWRDAADLPTLRRSCTLAARVARVGRSLSWQRALRGAGTAPEPGHRAAVAGWLDELGQPDPV
jgi:hypothetical protein